MHAASACVALVRWASHDHGHGPMHACGNLRSQMQAGLHCTLQHVQPEDTLAVTTAPGVHGASSAPQVTQRSVQNTCAPAALLGLSTMPQATVYNVSWPAGGILPFESVMGLNFLAGPLSAVTRNIVASRKSKVLVAPDNADQVGRSSTHKSLPAGSRHGKRGASIGTASGLRTHVAPVRKAVIGTRCRGSTAYCLVRRDAAFS